MQQVVLGPPCVAKQKWARIGLISETRMVKKMVRGHKSPGNNLYLTRKLLKGRY